MSLVSRLAALAVMLAIAGPALADPPAPAPAASTRLILLGTGGGPTPRVVRGQPASLLIVNGKPYLIDAGDGVAERLAAVGLMPANVRTIFITHHHLDHNAGLAPLIGFTWFEDNQGNIAQIPPVQIYGPPATEHMVRAALDYLGAPERIFRAGTAMSPMAGRFIAHDIKADGVVYQDANVKVTAAENSHFFIPSEDPESGRDKSYSYRFDTAGRSVVFTGDTGPSDALVKLAMGADVLVSEVDDVDAVMAFFARVPHPPQPLDELRQSFTRAHLTPEAVGQIAAAAHVKSVVLTHFVPGLDSETDASRYLAGVRKYYSGPVIAGRDLLEY